MSTEYTDDVHGLMRVHIAQQRSVEAGKRHTRDELRRHAQRHGLQPSSLRKYDLGTVMAYKGLIDENGYLREGFPFGRFTGPQVRDWMEAIERLRRYYGEIPVELRRWRVEYDDEVRPGWGHSINATYVDGEVFAQIMMDVYGYPNVSIGRLTWEHSDSNEECDCEPCVAEREEVE